MRDQTPERKALRAALTAASTSLASLRATSQMTELSTGLTDSKRRPFLASTNLPSMKLRVQTQIIESLDVSEGLRFALVTERQLRDRFSDDRVGMIERDC